MIKARIQREISDIHDWLEARPSASMDPAIETRIQKLARLRELNSMKKQIFRAESSMMTAQNAIQPEYDIDEKSNWERIA
jgi:hypothetical protein